MPIHVNWHGPERRILITSLVGKWSWQDVDRALALCKKYLDDAEHSVYGIYDLSETGVPPPASLIRLRLIIKNNDHPNYNNNVIIVNAPRLLRIMIDTYMLMHKSPRPDHILKIHYTESVEEAIELVKANLM